MEPALCKKCRGFDIHAFKRLRRGILTYDMYTVDENARHGCRFCRFLRQVAVAALGDKTGYEQIDLSISGYGHLAESPMYNKLQMMLVQPSQVLGRPDDKIELEVCIAAESDSAASQVVGGRYLGEDRMSSQYLSALRARLDHCITNHPRCGRTLLLDSVSPIEPYDSKLPTRCLEVTADGGCFLRITAGLSGSYIILSHRWNDFSKACKTTFANYEERIAGRDLRGILSRNFHDTAEVAHGLGIQYVWIDSLCIIQDSPDWDEEKGKMGRYYQHALFTVAAINSSSNASNGDETNGGDSQKMDEGFLSLRSGSEQIMAMVRMPYRENGPCKGHMYIFRRKQNANAQFVCGVDRSELLTRGWVFQEWLLSRRIFYFTRDETFIECVSNGPTSIHNDVVDARNNVGEHGAEQRGWFNGTDDGLDDITARSVALRHGFKAAIDLQSADTLFPQWYALIRAYSTTVLGYQEDHLAAISGIAGEYLTMIESREKGKTRSLGVPNFFSGLWLQDLCNGLLWLSAKDMTSVEICSCPAPSWSWMSIASPVTWLATHKYTEPAIEIVGAGTAKGDCGGSFDDSQVLIMVTRLTIRARLQPVLLSGLLDGLENVGLLTGVELVPGSDYYSITFPQTPQYVGGWAKLERSQSWPSGSDQPKSITALHVATRKKVDGVLLGSGIFTAGHDVYNVLLVERVEDSKYRRLGMGMVFDQAVLRRFRESEITELMLV